MAERSRIIVAAFIADEIRNNVYEWQAVSQHPTNSDEVQVHSLAGELSRDLGGCQPATVAAKK